MDEDNVEMVSDGEKDDGGDDKLEDVGPGGPVGSTKSRSHPCRFCSESFSSELRLILHFRKEHLDPDEESLSEDESESAEEEEDSDVNTSMLNFLTDCERAHLQAGRVINPDPESGGRIPEKLAKPDTVTTKVNVGQSSKVIIRPIPHAKAQVGDPENGRRSPEKPQRTTKTAAKKSIDKRKWSPSRRIKGPFNCVFCDKSYSRSYLLHNHIRSHTMEKPYFCKLCDDSFAVSGDLQTHIRVSHLGVTPFKCKLCSESFPNRTTLKYHMTTHSPERKFQCEHCEMRFHHLSHLSRHLQCHIGKQRSYECDICKKGFTRLDILRRHREDVHHIARDLVKKEMNFECEHCKKRFIRKTELTGHMRSVHHVAVSRATTTTHDPKKEKKFECEYCKTRFVQKSDMNKHVRTFHSSSVRKIPSVSASKDSIHSTTS